MLDNQQKLMDDIKALSEDKSFREELAQVRAKTLLKEITQSLPKYSWNYIESRIIRNTTAASFMAETLSILHPEKIEEIKNSTLRLALTWESLGKLGETTNKEKAFTNAAFGYELSGYQANAACIARYVYGHLEHNERPSIIELASLYLQRLFLQTKIRAKKLLDEPQKLKSKYEIISEAVMALAGLGFIKCSEYFLSGNSELLKDGEEKFIDAEKILAELGLIEEYNIIRSVRSLIHVMENRSTWSHLSLYGNNTPLWTRYLKLLARGTGANILASTSISELWPSQITALENELLDVKSNKIIRMPTSSGKTRIAELAMVHTLVTIPDSKCVYIAPYRALVWELEQVFLNLFGDLGFRVSSIVGTYETDDFENALVNDADILVMTPEKLDMLQRANSEFLDKVRLFIMDEGHIINDQNRGIKFELLLARLKKKLHNARFLFLSAVVSHETLEEFTRWFEAKRKGMIETAWRPTILRHAKFYWKGESGIIRYETGEDNPLIGEFASGIIRQRTYAFQNTDTGRLNKRLFPGSDKSQTAAELAFKFAELGPVLVFCAQTNFVESVAKSLLMRLNYTEMIDEQIPKQFNISRPLRSIMVAEDWLGTDHLVTRLLKKGIAVHHGNLPEALRKAIEIDFREKRYQIIIATNTLAQGVNLPIRTVIMHTCRRHTENDVRERIPDRDYWNIAGRAGRAGEETEGTIIHMTFNEIDESDYLYYKNRRDDLEPVNSALLKLLQDLVDQRISEIGLREKLDPEILAILAEETGDNTLLQNIDEVLKNSLVKEQVRRHNLQLSVLKEAFHRTANQIIEDIPDSKLWPVYSTTGLSAHSCEVIRKYVVENFDVLHNLFVENKGEHPEVLMTMILPVMKVLHEMEPHRQFHDHEELLKGWLSGKGVYSLAKDFNESTENLAKFIEEYFGYLLPWGISAFIKISTSVMELDDSAISNNIKFLPSMVKYGVPTPEVAWAMISGVPFRATAMDIAAKYVNQTNITDFQNFREWIGKFNSETLHHEFKLKSPVLEDVTCALLRTSTNPLLRDQQNLDKILKDGAWVVGIKYDKQRVLTAMGAKLTQEVVLTRDYENPVDRNAIKVFLNGHELGFLERPLAQFLAPDMDCGMEIQGKIIQIEKTKIPNIKIKMEKL